jgi:hypothetical protein
MSCSGGFQAFRWNFQYFGVVVILQLPYTKSRAKSQKKGILGRPRSISTYGCSLLPPWAGAIIVTRTKTGAQCGEKE